METKHKNIISTPRALKVQDDFNRHIYKHLISKLSKAIMIKPQYVWEISSSGVPEVLSNYEISWPFGVGIKTSGFICMSKSLANLIIHYSLGGNEKRKYEVSHNELTFLDTKILEKFLSPILDFTKEHLSIVDECVFHQWIDNPQLLPFLPPGKKYISFESEISFDADKFSFMIFSNEFSAL